jgi:hypothetical protein
MMHGCAHRPIPHTNYRPNFNGLARLPQLRQNPLLLAPSVKAGCKSGTA